MTINLAAIESGNEERKRLICAQRNDEGPYITATSNYFWFLYATRSDTATEDIAALLAEVRRLQDIIQEIGIAVGSPEESDLLTHLKEICDESEARGQRIYELRRLEGQHAEMNAVIRKQSERIQELLNNTKGD
jgi:hypothetical protein